MLASQGSGRRQPLRILPEPQLWSFGRQLDGDARRWAVGGAPSLFGQLMPGHFHETDRPRVVLLLEPSPLLALEEPGPGSTGRTEPLLLRSGHQLALDMEGFSAEELSVQLEGRKLTVLGHQEKEAAAAGHDGCCVCRESRQVRKELLLPLDADLEALTCALGPDGHLRVRAPRLERAIPVTVERRSPSEAGEADGGAPAGSEKPDGADEQVPPQRSV